MLKSIHTINNNEEATKVFAEYQNNKTCNYSSQQELARLYEYSKKIFMANPSVKMINNTEDKEDVFQNTMLEVIEKKEDFDLSREMKYGKTSYNAWFNTIAKAQVIDYLRKESSKDMEGRYQKRQMCNIDTFAESITASSIFLITNNKLKEQTIFSNNCSDYVSPEDYVLSDEVKEVVNSALAELKKENEYYAKAIELHYYKNMKQKDIALVLGTNEKGVENYLSRARAKMKKKIIESKYEIAS